MPGQSRRKRSKFKHSSERMNVVAYLIHYVDGGLSVTSTETIHHIGLPPREDRFDKGWKFIVWNGASDQSLPSPLLGVDSNGWIGGMSCRIGTR